MKNLALAIILTCPFTALYSQSIGGMNFNLYNTLSDFNRHVDATPAGVSLMGLYRIEETRLLLGGELGVAMYAGETYHQEIIVNGSKEEIEVFEEDCFFTYQASARYLFFDEALINPYGELKLGGTSFFSTIMANEEVEYFEDDTQFHGTAFHASLGAGLMIGFGPDSDIGIDISASYMPGSKAKYRNMAASDAFQSSLGKGTFESTTSQLNYRLGVYFLLW